MPEPGKWKLRETRQRQKVVGVRLSDEEHALLMATAARWDRTPASALRDLLLAAAPDGAPAGAGLSQSRPPANLPRLASANSLRANAAGQRDAGSAVMILARLGDSVRPGYRQVAEARIAAPSASWSEIAATLGMTKDAAIGKFRRMLEAAREQLGAPSEAGTEEER